MKKNVLKGALASVIVIATMSFTSIMEKMKSQQGVENDSELSGEYLQELCRLFKSEIIKTLGEEFPDDPHIQLWGGITAVFTSWNGKRAVDYRNAAGIPHHLGTAVNIVVMVFGNMGGDSATGVAMSRNASTGQPEMEGDYLTNAQGEDVVAGIRTPQPISVAGGTKKLSLEATMPKTYKQLLGVRKALEAHFKDMQDVEFTIENNKLWMLQTRVGKRTGVAAIKIATDMVRERLINKKEAVSRVKPGQVYESMLKNIRAKDLSSAVRLGSGLPAGPGASTGQVVFCAEKAEKLGKKGKQIILVRNETSPEDIHGMRYAAGILTSRGGLTSHAALVARGWGKSCIVGCQDLKISKNKKSATFGDKRVKEGDWITLNGTDGSVFDQKLGLFQQPIKDSKALRLLLRWADRYRRLKVRTNADTPEDCKQAVEFGAQGLGLCRTEHMFFDEKRIHQFRKMILAEKKETRIKHLKKLLPHQRKDFYNIFKTMEGFPVTIRLLDPPLHEFIGVNNKELEKLSKDLGKSKKNIEARINELREDNPMLGHRGCRLGISYPEITEMQAEAILGAALKLKKEKGRPKVEIMVPLVGNLNEFLDQKSIILETYKRLSKESGQTLGYKIGTMIEVPRACFSAKEIAKNADFFSFGTNDLTQTVFGFSRDDVGTFFQTYFEKEILSFDPFETISEESVGALMKMAVKDGKKGNPKLSLGICGEHGGDPKSIYFCSDAGLDYVSCSPYRVPIARLAAAQAELKK